MARGRFQSFVAGAACMYFADPNRGPRRRAIARDKFLAACCDVASAFERAGLDFRNRIRGVASAARASFQRADADGPVLVERVRAAVGRAVSRPHAIRTRTEGPGRIVLEGPVLRYEVDYLLKRIRSVPGVAEVIDRLQVYEEPGGISDLQGGVPRRSIPEFAQQSWTPSLRVAAGAAAASGLYASLRARGPLRWVGTAGSAVLLARVIANKPLRQIFGVGGDSGAVHFEKTIHIDAPVEEV
jgi:hypothetical protein